jgi:hypothetical protein
VVFKTITTQISLGGSGLDVRIILSATGPLTGTLPAAGGAASVAVPVQAKVEAYLNGTPLLGSTSNCIIGPLSFDLRGSYDAGSKTLTVGSDSIALPAAGEGCGALGGQVNGLLGLPSSANAISLTFGVSNSAIVATPDPIQPPVVTPPATIEPGVLGFGKLSSTIAKDVLSVPVKCTGKAGGKSCAGKVTLAAKVTSGKKTKTVTLGSATYAVGVGKTKTYKLKLSSSARKYIEKAGKKGLKATVAILPTGAKKATLSKSLVLKLPATKKK